MPQPAEKIQKILSTQTQSWLATKLGITQGTVSAFATGRKEPGPATCLALAGICPSEDVQFWLLASGLTEEALNSIARALGLPRQIAGFLPEAELSLLDWWRTPGNATAEAAKTIVHSQLGLSPPLSPESSEVLVPESNYLDETKHAHLHHLLHMILGSGIESFVSGITSNLQSWGEVVLDREKRRLGGQSDGDPEALSPAITAEIERINSLIKRVGRSRRESGAPTGRGA